MFNESDIYKITGNEPTGSDDLSRDVVREMIISELSESERSEIYKKLGEITMNFLPDKFLNNFDINDEDDYYPNAPMD